MKMIRRLSLIASITLACALVGSAQQAPTTSPSPPSKAQRAVDRAMLDLQDLVDGLAEAAKEDLSEGILDDIIDDVIGGDSEPDYYKVCREVERIRRGLRRHQRTHDAKALRLIERLRRDLEAFLKDCRRFGQEARGSAEEIYARQHEALKKVLNAN